MVAHSLLMVLLNVGIDPNIVSHMHTIQYKQYISTLPEKVSTCEVLLSIQECVSSASHGLAEASLVQFWVTINNSKTEIL